MWDLVEARVDLHGYLNVRSRNPVVFNHSFLT